METLVLLLMLLVALGFVLKLTFMRPWLMVAELAVLALVPVLSADFAAMQSKTMMEEWLGSPALMLDVAVVLTVDVAMQIAFCFCTASGARNLKARITHAVLLYVPGILVYALAFYVLVEMIFSFPGFGFAEMGLNVGGAIIIIGVASVFGLRYLLPEKSIRLELIFYVNGIIALLGVIATVNGRTASVGVNELNLPAMAAMAGLLLCGGAAGYFIYKRKITKLP